MAFRITITIEWLIKHLKKHYTCPLDFFTSDSEVCELTLFKIQELNKTFGCFSGDVKVPIVHLPCTPQKSLGKRDKCWQLFFNFLTLEGGECEKEIKEEG